MQNGVSDPIAIEALYYVAKRFGALGDVVNVCQHSALFAGGGKLENSHILAAIEDLKLTPKGGRI